MIPLKIKKSILELEQQLHILYVDKTESATEAEKSINPEVIFSSGFLFPDATPCSQVLEILTNLYSCTDFHPRMPNF